MACCSSISPAFLHLRQNPAIKRSKSRTRFQPISSSLSDPFVLRLAETLEDSFSSDPSPSPSPSLPLQKLRETSSQSLLSKSWPSSKDEPFRFTDTSFLKSSQILPTSLPPSLSSSPSLPTDTHLPFLTLLDGHVITSLSNLSPLPSPVFVGPLSNAPSHLSTLLLDVLSQFPDGDLFWDLNGVGAPDIAVVYVPAGCRVETPLHLRFCSWEGTDSESKLLPVSNPRALVLVEEGGEIGIIEEYLGGDGEDKCYWANSVTEFVIRDGATVRHSYIQRQSSNASHIKWTFVQQGSSSTYELVETSTGGKLSRHNLHIQQLGSDTVTELSTFHLSGSNQTQDLHSRLVLDHPRGYSRQLHKCIVTHSSGHAVFDGNVQVNRLAQQTDAGQLTRSLLMVPRATVNVKPNLQIIADDVKCSHGAAISDLEEDQLFYFRARGIDLQTARNALIFSFGAEVTDRLPYEPLRKSVQSHLRDLLAAKGAIQ